MTLGEYCEKYLVSRESIESHGVFLKKHSGALQKRLARMQTEDIEWISESLTHRNRKWFVAEIFRSLSISVPESLFQPMIYAAICEVNPSFNKYFVRPCVSSQGHRRVNEALLQVLKTGSNFEKAGAVAALYWADLPICFKGMPPKFKKKYATSESVAAYDALSDIWKKRRYAFLKEFVNNEDLHVRRSIIPSLNLKAKHYPRELKPLVSKAIRIAKNHTDEYIRHRVQVQLGKEKLLKPIPHREENEDR